MAKKIIRYISLLTPIIFVISVVVNSWCVKDTITDKGYTSSGWGLFNTPHDYLVEGTGFSNVWLILFGIFVILSLVVSIVMVTIMVLNGFKITNLQKIEKYLAISVGVLTVLGLLFGLFAIIANAHLGFMATSFVETSRLVPMAGFYIYTIGGLVFSTISITSSLLQKNTTE